MYKKHEYLLIGGTGSLGNALTDELIKRKNYRGIRIYSRTEFLQWKMKQKYKEVKNIAYLIGAVEDEKRLSIAMRGVDIAINMAAQKQVPSCEENPIQCIQTNVMGARNVVNASIENKVKRVMHISTDKAVYPINIYGVSKAAAEKIFLHSSVYSPRNTKFAICRYGNVASSRGSIIPLIREQAKTGTLTLTHKEMTRFWITLSNVAQFILDRIEDMEGGEIFIPKMISTRIIDLMKFLAPGCKIIETGIRPGEKIAETIISYEESEKIKEKDKYFILQDKNKKKQYYSLNSANNDMLVSEKNILAKIAGY